MGLWGVVTRIPAYTESDKKAFTADTKIKDSSDPQSISTSRFSLQHNLESNLNPSKDINSDMTVTQITSCNL